MYFERVLPRCVAIQRTRKHVQRPAWQREKISVGPCARFCGRPNRDISSEHDEHLKLLRRRFGERPLNLIRLSASRFAIAQVRAFE